MNVAGGALIVGVALLVIWAVATGNVDNIPRAWKVLFGYAPDQSAPSGVTLNIPNIGTGALTPTIPPFNLFGVTPPQQFFTGPASTEVGHGG
jgi:hypothetical protein